ncbi:MAG: hypothetical protein JWP97_6557 [Labilithrix sp.]|nr:hypothetical protein [Labilithrix sp.]
MLFAGVLFVHLASFALYVGTGLVQLTVMKRSAAAAGEARAALEQLAATLLTKLELPAIFGSVLSGALLVMTNPAYMKQGWLHGKLLVVVVLLVLTHLEMFNAKAIVRLRDGAAPESEIAARKSRHALWGRIGGALVLALLFLVTFVRLGALRAG